MGTGQRRGRRKEQGRGALCITLVLLAWLAWPAVASAQKLVILVRHAERADAAAGVPPPSMTAAPADPLLSAAGEARATTLAAMLAESGVNAIYATEFKRTQDTGKPLASRLGLAVRTVSSRETNTLVARLKADHANDVVLIVGHSNTLPAIIKALGGPDVTIADSEYDNLFIVVPATGTMTRLRF